MEPKYGKDVFIADGAKVAANVTLGDQVGVWFNAVIRGDEEPIVIGARTNIQDNAVVHTAPGFPVHIGSDVTVGHNAIVHGCDIGDGTLIGMGAIVLNGAKVGKHCIIGAGALVKEGDVIPDGMMAVGLPAKVKKEVSEEAKAEIMENAGLYIELQDAYR